MAQSRRSTGTTNESTSDPKRTLIGGLEFHAVQPIDDKRPEQVTLCRSGKVSAAIERCERRSRKALNDAGRFIWEDAADTYASAVTDWWAGCHAGSGLHSITESSRGS